MKTKILLKLIILFATQLTSGQILYSENFDNLALGNVGTVFTGQTPGQGGWHTFSHPYNIPTDADNKYFKIVSEPNKGKVLQFAALPTVGRNHLQLRGLNVLWNNRSLGNNVLKVSYDFFTGSDINMSGRGQSVFFLNNNDFTFTNSNTITYLNYRPDLKSLSLLFTYLFSPQKLPTLSKDTWYTFIFYIDYTTQQIYFTIPSVGLLTEYDVKNQINPPVSLLILQGTTISNTNTTSVFKYDNFTISAVNTVPLSNQDFVSDKFNLYPNPAKDILNITNNENLGIELIKIYDTNGKLINTKMFNKEPNLQLDISNYATGTYLLHISTTNGTAIKKVIKK